MYPRLEGPRPDDIRLIARSDAGWFWLIPIFKGVDERRGGSTEVLYRRLANGSPEEMLDGAISDTPIVRRVNARGRREWPVRVEKDFSYSASAYAGHRWILLGTQDRFSILYFRPGSPSLWNRGLKPLPRSIARWRKTTLSSKLRGVLSSASAGGSRRFAGLFWDSTHHSSASSSSTRTHRGSSFSHRHHACG